MSKIKLFSIAFLGTFLSIINIYHVQHNIYLGTLIFGFIIPFLSTFILRYIVFGSLMDKVVYASGVSVGGVSGLYFANLIYDMLNVWKI